MLHRLTLPKACYLGVVLALFARLACPSHAAAALAGAATPEVIRKTTFVNPVPITIRDKSAATPYPSSIHVEKLPGAVVSVAVTLRGFTHPAPADVDLLLLAPDGHAVVLLSDAGGLKPVEGIQLRLEDGPDFPSVPANPAAPIVGGTYRPTDHSGSVDQFDPPVPAPPYGNQLGVLRDTPPNGEWSIFVMDNYAGDAGVISGGWELEITALLVDAPPTLGGLESVADVPSNRVLARPFWIQDPDTPVADLVVSAAIDDPTLGTVELTGTGTNRTLVYTPTGRTGVATITVGVSDHVVTTNFPLVVTVTPPHLLEFAPIDEVIVPENGSRQVAVDLVQVDPSPITLSATIANTNVISRVEFVGSGIDWTARLVACPGAGGSTRITLAATDARGSVSATFVATIATVDDPPSLAVIPDQLTNLNTPLTILVGVNDPDTPVAGLRISAAASNQLLVESIRARFDDDGTAELTLRPARDQVGITAVQVIVDDGVTKVSREFVLVVANLSPNPPTLASIPDQVIIAGRPAELTLQITDPDTPLERLVFSARSSTPGVMEQVGFVVTDGVARATLLPAADAAGRTTVVTITVSDGTTPVSAFFAVTVSRPLPAPSLALPTLAADGPGSSALTVRWSNAGELEYANTPDGPWIRTGNTTGTHTEPPGRKSRFYRVVRGN